SDMLRRPPDPTLSPYTTLFRSASRPVCWLGTPAWTVIEAAVPPASEASSTPLATRTETHGPAGTPPCPSGLADAPSEHVLLRWTDRKSTRLNSSHVNSSYAVVG